MFTKTGLGSRSGLRPERTTRKRTFKGKVVVVTGASAGLGRAIAHEFAKEGATLALIARNPVALEAACREVEELGGNARAFPLDVAESQAVFSAAAEIERSLGPIEYWVNDAMVSVFSPVSKMKPEEYKRVTDVTYLGYVYGTMAALKYMTPRNRGHILQVGSALSHRSIPLQSAYCAAKHAINGFTESLRTELMHDKLNINVSVVQMPALNTPQFSWVLNRLPGKPQPVAPIYQPEVGARAVVWTAKHPRKEVFVGNSVWIAIVGERVASRFADWRLAQTGVEGQQIPGSKADPKSANNLWEHVEGDRGTHGSFDSQSRPRSLEFDATHAPAWAYALIGASALLGAIGLRRALRDQSSN